MNNITIIGIDIAKNVFQIHATDDRGKPLFKKRVTRNKFLATMANLPKAIVGMEACGGAQYWANQLNQLGFDVRLMSPTKVKKYAEHHKNDALDAAACAEAVSRKSMRFIPIKTSLQLEIQSLHRIRSHTLKYKIALMNMIRGLLLEKGIAIPKGVAALNKKLSFLLFDEQSELDDFCKQWLQRLWEQLQQFNREEEYFTQQIKQIAKEDELSQRLQTIDGIGPITASAMIAKIANGSEFKKGRELSAFLGLVPKQYSSGDKQCLGRISKHGDRYLRQLLIHGGRAAMHAAMRKNKLTKHYHKQDKHSQWIRSLVERIGKNKTCVAIANKNARIIIALLKKQMDFQPGYAHGAVNV